MKFVKIKIKIKRQFSKVKKAIIGLPRIIAEKMFIAAMILFLLALILAALVFYKYPYSVSKTEIQAEQKTVQIKEQELANVLISWQAREERFKATDSKEYLNPF